MESVCLLLLKSESIDFFGTRSYIPLVQTVSLHLSES